MTVADPFPIQDEAYEGGAVPSEPGPGRRPVRGLFWGVLRRPHSTLKHISERSTRIWVVPTLLLALTGTAAAVVMIPSSRQAILQEAKEQFERTSGDIGELDPEAAAAREQGMGLVMQFTGIMTVVGSIASPFIAVLLLTAVLHLIGTVLGGQQTYGQMLAVASWARLPLVFQEVLRLVYGLGGGYDERMSGLSGLVADDHFAGPVLAEISIWNLWTLALIAVAVSVVSHVSRTKAIGAVVVVVLLRVALGAVGVAVSRATSGLGG